MNEKSSWTEDQWRADRNTWRQRAEKAEAAIEQVEHDAIAVLSMLADCEDDEPLCNIAGDAYAEPGSPESRAPNAPRRILTVGMVRQIVGALVPHDCNCAPDHPHTHGGMIQPEKPRDLTAQETCSGCNGRGWGAVVNGDRVACEACGGSGARESR